MTATTEHLHAEALGLDERPLAESASLMAEAQIAAACAVRAASQAIADAARQMARTIQAGGCLHYTAAGSSGLMAAADAQELGGTFSIPPTQLRIHMAGGLPSGVEMPGDTEDDVAHLTDALADLGPQDTMIAVSASGTTPYTVAALRIAKAQGAAIVGIANNAGTPLLTMADYPIFLETPPEILSGSTRMGAGTAQKIALNMASTLMAVELGHVHDGMMVNLCADNIKLRARACGMVERIAGVTPEAAVAALDRAGGRVKPAVLLAAYDLTEAAAEAQLAKAQGRLRHAMHDLNRK